MKTSASDAPGLLYESSLGTAVQLSFNARTKDFEVAVDQSKRQRKELRAYYTDPRLCRFMVERR